MTTGRTIEILREMLHDEMASAPDGDYAQALATAIAAVMAFGNLVGEAK